MTDTQKASRPSSAAVIIPTHDRPDSLKRLLSALEELAPRHRIVVVDDGSEPPVAVGSDRVQVVRNERAQLLASARNRGAAAADADILVFVDDDCVASPESVEALVRVLDRRPEVGIAGPVIAYLDSPDRIWCAGVNRGVWTGLTRFRAEGREVSSARFLPVDCGEFPSAFALRRSVFEEVGGFDEEAFPMHMSEADLSARVKGRGYRVIFVPEAVVLHDIPPDASLARRLHIADSDRAFVVARDRVRFLLAPYRSPTKQLLHMAFWFGVLVPVYLWAIMTEPGPPLRSKLRTAQATLAGSLDGLRHR